MFLLWDFIIAEKCLKKYFESAIQNKCTIIIKGALAIMCIICGVFLSALSMTYDNLRYL